MSNWREPSQQEEKRVLNAWNFNLRTPASVQNYDTNNVFKVKEMRGLVSDDCNVDSSNSTKNPWNQIFMQHDIDTQKNGDYKISASLKTLWNDVSDGSNFSSTTNHANVVQNTTQTSVGNDIQSKSVKTLGLENNIAVANTLHSNLLKGRAITARNGSYTPLLGNENANGNQTSNSSVSSAVSPLSPDQHQPLEKFLQKVQLIVKNGFLDPKILNEPISPDTFDLVQMLIFYVMEYSKTRNCSNSDTNPALRDEIEQLFYKINLIQNEIARCQLLHVEQKRIQEEILRSFSLDGLVLQQPNFNGPQFSSNQPAVAMTPNGNLKYNQHPSSGNLTPAANTCGYASKENNERFDQRQFNTNVSSSGKFAFLPKTKNIEKRSHFYEQNPYFSQRDGNFTTH